MGVRGGNELETATRRHMNTKRWRRTLAFIGGGLLAMSLLLGLVSRGQPSPASPTAVAADLSALQVAAKDGMVQVYVPAGEFLMGSTRADIDAVMQACASCAREEFTHEMPQHRVYLDAFWIDQTEVTNAMFAKFVAETGY